jgi:hypothetical protein
MAEDMQGLVVMETYFEERTCGYSGSLWLRGDGHGGLKRQLVEGI